MLLFGHTGLMLGAAQLLAQQRRIDYRLVLLGSLLPDIIDKPIGLLIFYGSFGSGRILGHTLLFALAILFIGLYLYKQGKPGMLILSLCSWGHLILDQMWQGWDVLLWPIFGWQFERFDRAQLLPTMVEGLHTNPTVYIPEALGAIIIAGFVLRLVLRKKLYAFIRAGVIE